MNDEEMKRYIVVNIGCIECGVSSNIVGVFYDDIKANDYSLTPGRYVGAAVSNQGDDEGEAFAARMKEIHADLADLNNTANLFAIKIQAAFAEFAE